MGELTNDAVEAGGLREREGRFRSAFEESSIGMALLAADGTTVRVNRALAEMLRYPLDEAGRTHWTAILHPDEIADAAAILTQIATGELPNNRTERRCVRNDGTPLWAQITVSRVQDATGQTDSMIVQLEDVSERKRLEDALREGAERLRLALAASNSAAYGWVDGTGELWWSDHGLELLGFGSDADPRTPAELWRHVVARDLREMLQSLLAAGRSDERETAFTHRFRVQLPSGEVAWRESRGLHRRLPGGGREVRTIVRDISADVAAETASREIEERLAMVLEATREGVWDWDVALNRVFYGPRWLAILGFPAEAKYADPEFFFPLIHPEDRERVRAATTRAHRREEAALYDETFRMQHTEGHWIWVRSRGRVISRNATGRALRMLGTHSDVTTQRTLEEQMRQTQKMDAIGKLAGGIAHDFNNLLTAIGATTELVLADLGPDNPHREHVQEIAVAADRAKSLTRQLLTFSRQEVEQTREVALDDVVRRVAPLLHRLLGPAQSLELVLDAGTSMLRLDPANLELALLNLVANARDAMPHGGTITITTTTTLLPEWTISLAETPYVAVIVRDSGVGMSPEVQQRLFEPFFTTKPQGEGTGLGMTTVYGFVRRLGGAVQVESKVGEGTTARLLLPLHAATPTGPIEQQPSPVHKSPQAVRRVLLVDDDDFVRRSTTRLLEHRKIVVTAVSNADDALLALEAATSPFDVVLSDHAMPGRTGHELLEAIRAEHPTQRVVLMSGFADDGNLRKTFGSQEIPFLAKPFTATELMAVLEE